MRQEERLKCQNAQVRVKSREKLSTVLQDRKRAPEWRASVAVPGFFALVSILR